MLSFTTLMISDVTLSPMTVAADLRPVLLRLARELRKETEQLGITARQATLLWLVKRNPGLSLSSEGLCRVANCRTPGKKHFQKERWRAPAQVT